MGQIGGEFYEVAGERMRRHLRWHCFPSVPYPGLTYPGWRAADRHGRRAGHQARAVGEYLQACICRLGLKQDRKSTRLNSSHSVISYAVFCLKKKKRTRREIRVAGKYLELKI